MSLQINVNGKKHLIPNAWNELSALQLKAFINLILVRFDQVFEIEGKSIFVRNEQKWNITRLSLLYYLLDLPKKVFRQLDEYQLDDLINGFNLLKFLFEECKLTKNHVPFICSYFQKLYSPGDDFSKIEGEEFSYADSQFIRYKQTKNVAFLDRLIAILYRKKDKNYNPEDSGSSDDLRESFNPKSIESRIKIVRKIPLHKKLAILLWYEGSRNLLPVRYPNIFTDEKQSDANNFGWVGVLLASSGGKFGSYNETKRTRLLLLLAESERFCLEALLIKRKHTANS
jgi:hypothetical protein